MRPTTRVAVALAAATLAGAAAYVAVIPPSTDPGAALSAPPPPAASTPPQGSPRPDAAPRPAITIATRAATQTPVQPRAQPTALVIPAIDAELPVEPVGVDADGAMELPASPRRAGWYRFGPAPGSDAGATVIAAHVDAPREGRGPLAGLVRLRPGDAIEVRTDEGTRRYEVTEVLRIDKGELDPGAVFSREGRERLHVVSCGGRFDRAAGHYDDNVIAVAVPVAS